jgi:hypothetical protein
MAIILAGLTKGAAGRRQREVEIHATAMPRLEGIKGQRHLEIHVSNPSKAESQQRHSSLAKGCRISWVGVKLSRLVSPQVAGPRQIRTGNYASDQLRKPHSL